MKQHLKIATALTRILALALLLHAPVHAQTYPVQTHVVTSGPYFNYLSYYGDQNNHVQVIVTLLDFNLPPVMARLRIRIEGPGYELYTNPNAVVGQPFLLEAGVPLNLSGIDLLPYLQQNNLIVSPQGVDINALPEGFTTICVDVIKDGTSQEVLSTNNCTAFNLFKFQPPQTFLPQCATELDTTQMYYTFQWSPPIGYTPDLNSDLTYTFSLYRWNDPSNFSIFTTDQGLVWRETDLTMAQVQVSDLDVAFELGGLYVWRVEAQISSNGMPVNMILNNGFSENCTFTFGQAPSLAEVLADGLYIDLFAEPSAENKGKAYWTVIDNTPNVGLSTFDQFFVEYRKQPTGNEGFEIQWFPETVTDFDLFIYQLEPSTTYEVKVSGVVGGVVGDPTPVKTFTTPAARVYACGESDLPFLPTTFAPLENALAGIQVQIGQFKMDISEITPTGATGHYEGKGTIPIAFLAGAKAKVTFEDILIDTEFRVREGRVDVVTQGLENWLLEQYEQFIDPIYVNGVIDSVYIDSSGVAWAVVDGVTQSFPFDPPTYPIILNDQNGFQYKIEPNGTITISIYLEVSEYWTLAPSEVVHFGQNQNEARGFDGKEFMQWHEQYEVMQLADTTFYFVANKSMAANEADVVNVQLPPINGGVSFQFADGSPVTSSSLNGTWLGVAPHGSAEMKTLTIPARSAGEYQIHAYANNQKVGQLNVTVYGEKEKELIVVPLVSNFSFTDTQIEAELKATLGEANIDVSVTVSPQWVDTTNTFTASTTISLPTEVGLLTKYSEDMKALRDAYLAANPNADKTKFYVFVVAGFDDPSEMGYMVRGRSMGFIRAGNPNMLETLSHELGHGMGALEHSWKNNGPDETTTSNLMDYASTSSGGAKNNLTRVQWIELRDADFVPSLWDEVDDYLFQIADLCFEDVTISLPLQSQLIHKDDILVDEAVKVSGTLVRFSHAARSRFTHFVMQNGSVVGLKDNGVDLQLVTTGYQHKPAPSSFVEIDLIVENQVGCIVFFRVDAASVSARVYSKALYEAVVLDVVTGYASGDVTQIEFVDCNSVGGAYVSSITNSVVVYGQIACPEEGNCPSQDLSSITSANKKAVKDEFRKIIQSANGGFSWNSICFLNNNHVFSLEDQAVIQEKIRTLNHYRNDVVVGVITLKGEFNQLYTRSTIDQLANEVVTELASEFPTKKLVLFFTHYITGTQENLFTSNDYACIRSTFASSSTDLIDPYFTTAELSLAPDVLNSFLLMFTEIKKPYYLTNIYEKYDGSIVTLNQAKTQNELDDLAGFPFVHGARNIVSIYRQVYLNYLTELTEVLDEYETELEASELSVEDIPEWVNLQQQYASQFVAWKAEDLANAYHWIDGSVQFDKIREHYLIENVAKAYFAKEKDECTLCQNISLWASGGSATLSTAMYYDFNVWDEVIDPIVYGVVDVLGCIPIVDLLADATGLIYSAARGDGQTSVIYGLALSTPFVGAGGYKLLDKSIAYYARKNSQSIYEVSVKQWNEVVDGWTKISDDIPVVDGNLTQAKSYLNAQKNTLDMDIVEDVVKLKKAAGVGGVSTFLNDGFVLSKRAEVISQGLPSQFPNLTIDELTAIRVYTSDELRNGVKIYAELNSQLRLGNLDSYYQGLHKLLDDGLSNLTPYTGTTVYRGCGSTESQIARNYTLGDEIKFSDFKSASTASVEAGDFVRRGNGDVIYEISNPTGYNVCPISCSPDEMEILFRTEGVFKVSGVLDNIVIYDKDFNVVTSTGRKIQFNFLGYE